MGSDTDFMRRAIALAEHGRAQVAPNPLVGAVIVRDGVVVAEGWHARYGAEHAEAMALRLAGESARGATAYVTLEPCAHFGKTPPCADALIAAGVARVVFAVPDPSSVAGGGAARLRAAGLDVIGGVEQDATAEQLAPFLFAETDGTRPFITLKLAVSIDGAIARVAEAHATDDAHAGSSGVSHQTAHVHTAAAGTAAAGTAAAGTAAAGTSAAGTSAAGTAAASARPRTLLTGPEAARRVHAMRADADAVAVGIGTALADDPLLTVRGMSAPRIAPLRIVFDRGARLPLDGRLAQSAREFPVIVITEGRNTTAERALEARGVTVVHAVGLAESMGALRSRGVRRMLVEGGSSLSNSLVNAGLVDRLVIFQAPVLLGGGGVPAFGRDVDLPVGERRLTVVSREVLGDDVMTIYR